MKKVSIIVPTCRREVKMLNKAIQSLINQSYKNIEIVVVDDNGSPELRYFRKEILKYINKLSKTEKRLIYIPNKENLGESFSRNAGIKASTGYFVTFLDDDDVYLENKIKHQVEFMEKNNLNFSFTNLSIYNKNNKLIDRRTRYDITSFNKNDLIAYHLSKMITGTETFMSTKKLLLDVGGFEKKFGEEFYLMFKILNYRNLRIGFCPTDDIKAYRTKQSCLSNGPKKINGEKTIYQFKMEHFYLLNKKQIKYVKFRHRVVMFVSYYRNHKYFNFIKYLFASFFANPFLSINEAIAFKKRIK